MSTCIFHINDILRPIEWWQAQCIFMGLPLDHYTTELQLCTSLKCLMLDGGNFSDRLIQTESAAIACFNQRMETVKDFISNLTPFEEQPPESPPHELSPIRVNTGESPGVIRAGIASNHITLLCIPLSG
jgi:hypothetical protein